MRNTADGGALTGAAGAFPRGLLATILIAVTTLAACAGAPTRDDGSKKQRVPLDPPIAVEPGAYTGQREAPKPVLIRDATLLTADDARPRIERGWIRLRDGRIEALGEGDAPAAAEGEQVIDAKGRFVTPGLIDTHSHLGVYPSPGVEANADGNEMTNPITAGVRAEEAFWPQDPGIQRAVAGGVTTIQALPGSGNLMGGHGVVLKLHPARESRAMRFPGAKDGLKMACGENPKWVYGIGRKTMPMSRMGSLYLMRDKWIAARRYRQKWAEWRKNPTKKEDGEDVPNPPPDRDLVLETLAAVLDGDILVHIHCYRADEMLLQLKLADEFGFKVRSFHHAVEAYKIRDVLAAKDVSVSTWADWWGFKIEAEDAIEQNLALVSEAGARGVLHTDSAEGIQRMNQEAAKALASGQQAGVKVTEHDAIKWITANPAWALGIDAETGALTPGRMADVVIWDHHPFSVYARAEKVFIDGHLRHDAAAPGAPWSDFEVGREVSP
ncbi:MAG: amidohydrolase [Myxococcales bacterium]|nr:amidohydrolase [Myxococcales bacterium]